jgi:hypothetical protein
VAIGPFFWPRLLSALLILFSALLVVEAVLVKGIASGPGGVAKEKPPFRFTAPGMVRVYKMFGILAVFCAILHFANFLTASAFLAPACMWTSGERRPIWLAAIAVAVPTLVYVIFVMTLNVPLP